MTKLGLVVNPIAGMGGRVGLKGTDGRETLERARELGATPVSPDRATRAIERLAADSGSIELYTYPGEMGEDEARSAGFSPTVVGEVGEARTSAIDTRRAAEDLLDAGVELLLFAGGDGTARDIHDAVDREVVVLGIPTGVKIHSSVYAVDPESAGELGRRFLSEERSVDVRRGEVMDIDEDAFREDRVSARLYGYLDVPFERRLLQNAKSGSDASGSAEACAYTVVDDMAPDTIYLVGPGTTTSPIMERLGLENTLLGVDAVLDGELLGSDLNEADILELLDAHPDAPAEIIVTVIGGQGFIFGRGNQQLSPAVIRRIGPENVTVLATEEKIGSLDGRPLRVDTGDPALDDELSGYTRVTTGHGREIVYRVAP